MQKITPFLTFNHQAEEAVRFYLSVFPNATLGSVVRYGAAGPGPEGSVMVVTFQLYGQAFIALNGGPSFTFSNGISLLVNCETQEEIDLLWERLSEGGAQYPCGWLQDKYGISWQIVPPALGQMMQDKDPERSKRVMQAMLKMQKIDLRQLEEAYHQVKRS
jgi:predicted 3-demethylubiquinone-9 3-methyltransferase (glyoxalase superfamily)